MANEQMYPYTAKEARERGELEQWRANYRANRACAGAIEIAIRENFDGMHLNRDCVRDIIDRYGYERTAFVLANTLQIQSYDERYHPSNRRWSQSVHIREDIGHRESFVINGHSAIIDGFVRLFRQEMEQAAKQEQGPSMNEMTM